MSLHHSEQTHRNLLARIPDATGRALLADPDEVFLRALEPGRHHVAVLVPAGPERLPVPGVPGVRPGLDHIPDGQAVSKRSVHPGYGSA